MTNGRDESERFAEAYRFTYPSVAKYVRRRAALDQVDDLIAKIYLVAWDKRSDFLNTDEPMAWLHRVGFGVVSNYYRKKRRWRALTTRMNREPATSVDPPPSVTEFRDEFRQAMSAMSTLSVDDQELIAPAAFEDLTYAEIAAVTGRTHASVRSGLTRARQRFRDAYDELQNPTSDDTDSDSTTQTDEEGGEL